MRAIVTKRMRATARFVLVGAQVGAVVGLLIHQIEGGPPLPHAVRGVASGILIGLLVGIGEEWVFVGRIRWRHYLWVTCVRVALYTGVIVVTLVLVNGGSIALTSDTGAFAAMAVYLTGDTMARDVVLAALVAVLGTAFLEVRHLHNPGDIRNFLLGATGSQWRNTASFSLQTSQIRRRSRSVLEMLRIAASSVIATETSRRRFWRGGGRCISTSATRW